MIKFLRQYQKTLFVFAVVILLLGTFVGLGAYVLTRNDMAEAVASVGTTKILYSTFSDRINQYEEKLRERGTERSEDEVKRDKQDMLRDMIVNELLHRKAQEVGITVTDDELNRDISNTPAFEQNGVFNQDVYFSQIRSIFHETPEQYERERRESIETVKLKQLIFQSAKLSPREVQQAYTQEVQKEASDYKDALSKHVKNAPKPQFAGNFEKDRGAFEAQFQQQRALDLINYYLRQTASQVEIRSYLDQRESGA